MAILNNTQHQNMGDTLKDGRCVTERVSGKTLTSCPECGQKNAAIICPASDLWSCQACGTGGGPWQFVMAKEDISLLSAEILMAIRHLDCVTFAELPRKIRPVWKIEGELSLFESNYENLLLWTGVNQALADALNELVTKKLIYYQQVDPLIYFIDGHALTLPRATKPRDYKHPRWLPVCLRPGPKPRSE